MAEHDSNAILAEILRRIDAGEQVDIESICQQHPEIADDLRSYVEGDELLADMAGDDLGGDTSQPGVYDETARPRGQAGPAIDMSGQKFGRYEIKRQLGQGAMGAVYLARDTQLDRDVALKIPKVGLSDKAEFLARFKREAQSAAKLNHPNICPVFDFGEVDGQPFITMAYVEGEPLSRFVGRKQVDNHWVANVIRKIAEGLAHAHEFGVIHRDLKSANVLVDRKGEPIVTDFGLAGRVDDNDETRLTQYGQLLGTPAYMSPEQLEGESSIIGPPSDIYALGVILYELLAGELPFRGTMGSLIAQVTRDDAKSPMKRNPDADQGLCDLCLKMLSKKPSQRPASMSEVATLVSSLTIGASKPKPVDKKKQAKLAKLEAGKERVAELVQRGQFPQAIAVLEKMAALKDKDAADYIAWAKEELGRIKAMPQKLRDGAPQLLAAAQKMMSRHDYGQAAQLLQQIPPNMRSAEAEKLLNIALELQDEADLLITDLKDCVATRTYDGIEDNVKRLLELKPGNKFAKDLWEALQTYQSIPRAQRTYRFDSDGNLQPNDTGLSRGLIAGLTVGVLAFAFIGWFMKGYLAKESPEAGKVTVGATHNETEESSISSGNTATPPTGVALRFNTTQGDTKDRVEIPSLVYDGSHPITIEAWVKPDPAAASGGMFFSACRWNTARDATGLHVGYVSSAESKKWHFSCMNGETIETPVQSSPFVGQTEWTHVAATRDGRDVALFVDGVEVGRRTLDKDFVPATEFVYLGGVPKREPTFTNIYHRFQGSIDELRVSNVIRFTDSFTPSREFAADANTIALYHFDEGSGDILKDSSDNGHDGKIVGANWVKGIDSDTSPTARSIDLLAGLRPSDMEPGWSRNDDQSATYVGPRANKITFQEVLPKSYEVTLVGSIERQVDQLAIGLPLDGTYCAFVFDSRFKLERYGGLEFVDGQLQGRGSAPILENIIEDGQFDLTVQVTSTQAATSIKVLSFDKPVLEWSGATKRLSLSNHWRANRDGLLTFGGFVHLGNTNPGRLTLRKAILRDWRPVDPQSSTAISDWTNLSNGRDFTGWESYAGGPVASGWEVRNSELRITGSGADIVTAEDYSDFELEFEWKAESDANSGVIYRVVRGPQNSYETGLEYQVLDSPNSADATDALRRAGALYGLYNDEAPTVAQGQWNSSRIVVNGSHIEHWLNGQKSVDAEIGSPEWIGKIKGSKFESWSQFAKGTSGRICLQNKGEPISYRNIRVRKLSTSVSTTDSPDWSPLFNGTDFTGWRYYNSGPVALGWERRNGEVRATSAGKSATSGSPYDIVTEKTYDNFELEFEWAMPNGGNSGILYRIGDGEESISKSGIEYQLFDDPTHAQWSNPNTRSGAIWPLYGQALQLKPRGQFNTGRIVANRNQIEHWLNGTKVAEATIGGDQWKQDAADRVAKRPKFASLAKGRIGIQTYGDELIIRNMRIREITKSSSTSSIDRSGPRLEFPATIDPQDPARVEIPSLKLDWAKPLTIEAWINPSEEYHESLYHRDVFFSAGYQEPSQRGSGVNLAINAREVGRDRELLLLVRGNQKPGRSPDSDSPVTYDSWNHVAFVWDGTVARCFQNGEVSLAETLDEIEASSQSVVLGATRGRNTKGEETWFSPFVGQIDEIRVSTTARYEEPFRPLQSLESDESTIALYHCDSDLGGRLIDSSGNGHHGKFVSARIASAQRQLTTSESNENDYALEFSEAIAGVVTVPTFADDGRDKLTVECWINPIAETDMACCAVALGCRDISQDGSDASKGFWVGVGGAEKRLVALQFGDYEFGKVTNRFNENRPVSGWTHVAVTRDGNRFRHFVNGKRYTDLEAPQDFSVSDQPMTLGLLPNLFGPQKNMGAWHTFSGSLDEVRVSDGIRYVDDFVPERRLKSDSQTLVHFHCDEGRGQRLMDSSGNGHHGELRGARWKPISQAANLRAGVSGPFLLCGQFGRSEAMGRTIESADSQPFDLRTPFTLEAWVSADDISGPRKAQFPIAIGSDGFPPKTSGGYESIGNRSIAIGCDTWQNDDIWFCHAWAPDFNHSSENPGTFEPNKWAHLAVSSDGSTVRFFVNGTPLAKSIRAADLPDEANKIWIGGIESTKIGQEGLMGTFYGMIDEIRLSSTARYTSSFVPSQTLSTDSDTLMLFHCDGVNSNVLADASGNGNDCSLEQGFDIHDPGSTSLRIFSTTQLKVNVNHADYHSFRITKDGIENVDNKYDWPTFSVNGTDWRPEKKKMLRFAEIEGFDETGFDINQLRLASIGIGTMGDVRYFLGKESIRFELGHVPAGAANFQLVFECDPDAPKLVDRRVSWIEPHWFAEFFRISKDRDELPEVASVSQERVVGRLKLEDLEYSWNTLGGGVNLKSPRYDSAPARDFVMVAKRTLNAKAGQYLIRVIAEDGVRVKIDGQTALDAWKHSNSRMLETVVPIEAGEHEIEVEYFSRSWLTSLAVYVERC